MGRTILFDKAPVVICVPARDEVAMLPALLSAIVALSVDRDRLSLCLYLDDCRDGSGALLDRLGPGLPFRLIVSRGGDRGAPNAGAARRAALAMGLELLSGGEGALFTTDADSQPGCDWVFAGLRALGKAEVAAGRIVRRDAAADPQQGRIEAYYDRLHHHRRTVDPLPWEARDTHHFSGGANIAVRASAYRALGGVRPLPSGEDAWLLDDAERAGMRVRRDGAMLVETSSRREGRIAGGLAGLLRALDQGEPPRLADPRDAAWQWRGQAAARAGFAAIDRVDVRASLGDRLGLTPDHILGVARDCPNAQAFAMRIVPAPPGFGTSVTLSEAEALLTELEGQWCGIAA